MVVPGENTNASAGETPAETTLETVINGAKTQPDAKPAEGEKAEGTKDELPAWTSQLPEDLRSNADAMKQLSKFAKVGDLAKSYAELEGKNKDLTALPSDSATAEELNAFYQKLGKPQDAKGYELEGEDAMNFRKMAYDNNLTATQAKNLWNGIRGFSEAVNKNVQEAQAKLVKETETSLKAEYGTRYGEKMQYMQRGLQAFGGNDLGKVLSDSGVIAHPLVVKLLISAGEMTSEGTVTGNGSGGNKDNYESPLTGGMMSFKGLK